MPAPRIMYFENKSGSSPGSDPGLVRPARIGRVSFSKTGRSLYYNGKTFRSLSGAGFKANFYDVESGEHYWISGPKKNGEDGLYGPRPTPIDQDVREEYWTKIRKLPDTKGRKTT
jgi:hypothetical protein